MLSQQELLNSVRKGAQMGCHGIDGVLPKARSREFRQALLSQRREYRDIFDTTGYLLEQLGAKAQTIAPAALISSRMMSRAQTMFNGSQTKLAEMMITGNTMGVVKSLRHLKDYESRDQAREIAEKMLETERKNIDQMQQYL